MFKNYPQYFIMLAALSIVGYFGIPPKVYAAMSCQPEINFDINPKNADINTNLDFVARVHFTNLPTGGAVCPTVYLIIWKDNAVSPDVIKTEPINVGNGVDQYNYQYSINLAQLGRGYKNGDVLNFKAVISANSSVGLIGNTFYTQSGAVTVRPGTAIVQSPTSQTQPNNNQNNTNPPGNTNNPTNSNTNNPTTPTTPKADDKLYNPLPSDDLTGMLLRIMKGFLLILGAWSTAFIIVGGFRMVLSQGNEEAYGVAKKTVTWAVLGMVIAILSFSIVAIVQNLIGANITPLK